MKKIYSPPPFQSLNMNNFHLYEEIGHGKNSTIYKGRRKFSIEYLAIKSVEKSKRSRVANEVLISQILFDSDLASPANICRAYQWHETRNHLWVISDYCAGGDLLRVLKQDERINSESQIFSFFSNILSGLICMHSNKIIFADMKPGNILFTESGEIKLCGFAVSQKIDDLEQVLADPSKQAPRRGSPYYMAPELFMENGFHSFASDFYALGCVLYEMITGKTPYSHVKSFGELQRTVVRSSQVPLDNLGFSPELRNLIARMLEKDPRQRITWRQLLQHEWVLKMSSRNTSIPSLWFGNIADIIEPIEDRFQQIYFSKFSNDDYYSAKSRSYSIDSITAGGSGGNNTTRSDTRRSGYTNVRE